MRIILDRNVWACLANTQRANSDHFLPHHTQLFQALEHKIDKELFISLTCFTLEALRKKDRLKYFGGDQSITMTLHQDTKEQIEKLKKLDIKILKPARKGFPENPDIPCELMHNDPDWNIKLNSRPCFETGFSIEQYNDFHAKIEDGTIKSTNENKPHNGLEYIEGKVSDNDLTTPEWRPKNELYEEYINRFCKSSAELCENFEKLSQIGWRKIIKMRDTLGAKKWTSEEISKIDNAKSKVFSQLVAEWSDIDTVNLGYMYDCDYICTDDVASGAGSTSIMSQNNKSFLEDLFNIKFITSLDLLRDLK